jgi:hypothetical protein
MPGFASIDEHLLFDGICLIRKVTNLIKKTGHISKNVTGLAYFICASIFSAVFL